MKNQILFLFILFCGIFVNAQDSDKDSYTIQRLIMFNENGEILLEKHPNGWMTPALRHNNKLTTNEGLKALAQEFGIEISLPRLAGIFMFVSTYKYQSSFRQNYIAKVVGGELKLPNGKLDAKWFSPSKAVEMMSLPEAKLIKAVPEMTEQILNYPDIIWGGTYTLWKEEGVTKYKLSENFYPIARVNK